MNNWWNYLEHSAKGSHWKEHKYVKIIDGVYYYPEGYKGGKYALPDGKSGDQTELDELKAMEESDKKTALKGWSSKLYKDIDENFDDDPASLFDPNSENYQNFKLTLAEFAGIDADELDLSSEELEKMRKTAYNHYAKSSSKSGSDTQTDSLSEEDIDRLAREVIRGNYGNGQERKDKLGSHYQEIQDRVNQILGAGEKKKTSSASVGSKSENAAKESASNGSSEADKWKKIAKNKVARERKASQRRVAARERMAERKGRQQVKHSYAEDENDLLMHFGIPRRSGRYPWGSGKEPYQSIGGIRKGGSATARQIEKNKRKQDEAEKKKRKSDSRYRRLLSDESLKKKISRLEAEKKLRELTEDELTPGQKFAKSVMTDSGKKVVTTILSGATLYGVKYSVDRKFNKKDFAEALFYGGPKKK